MRHDTPIVPNGIKAQKNACPVRAQFISFSTNNDKIHRERYSVSLSLHPQARRFF